MLVRTTLRGSWARWFRFVLADSSSRCCSRGSAPPRTRRVAVTIATHDRVPRHSATLPTNSLAARTTSCQGVMLSVLGRTPATPSAGRIDRDGTGGHLAARPADAGFDQRPADPQDAFPAPSPSL